MGMTLAVLRQYSSARATPLPGVSFTPASSSAISAPHSALASISSSMLPRCPMRNTLPLTSARPMPRLRLYLQGGAVQRARQGDEVSKQSGKAAHEAEQRYN